LDYSFESVRLATFCQHIVSKLSPSKLAKDGFYLHDDEQVQHFAATRPLEATFRLSDPKEYQLLQSYRNIMVASGHGPALLGWNVSIATAMSFPPAQTCVAHARNDLEADDMQLTTESAPIVCVTTSDTLVTGVASGGSVSIYSLYPTLSPLVGYNVRDCEVLPQSEHGVRFSIAAAYPAEGSSLPVYMEHPAVPTMAEDDIWDTIELGRIASTHVLENTSPLASALALTVIESLDEVGVVVSIHALGRRVARLVEYARADDGFFK
jgi:hypothetical protein